MVSKNEQLTTIWNKSLELLETSINDKALFLNFIQPAFLYSLEMNKAVIVTNTEVAKKILSSDHYSNLISDVISKVTQSKYEVLVFSNNDMKKFKQNEVIEMPEKKTFFKNSFLKSEYTFENFVVGKSNNEAFQASLFVSKKQGSLNPLFIYSKSGLGKTHLLHAIGNEVKNKNPTFKVLYITSDDFIDEFVKFVQAESDKESLKEFFRSIDFLLIDDIQFLADRKATGTMFFNIFNMLVASNKQIVITSDRPPKDLNGLEDRLVSRFSQGLSVSIEKPEKKTLIEILKTKIKANGFDPNLFDDDALTYIAENNSKNIRVLEGALNKIMFFNITSGNTNRITLELTKRAFNDDNGLTKHDKLNSETIIEEVAKYYSLTESQILSKIRTNQIALARSIAMYLCRKLLDMSYSQIGKSFNGKDHSTVMAACTKVEDLLKSDTGMKKAISKLEANLKN